MSWSGTVRCGWCYKDGHNKRSCAEFKKHVEANPDSYTAKCAARRKANAAPRRCSYCAKKGHNRRSCASLATAKTVWKKDCAAWRHKWADWVAEDGFGIGALVEADSGWDTRLTHVVVGFIWTSLNHEVQQSDYPHQAMKLAKIKHLLDHTRRRSNRLPHHPELCPCTPRNQLRVVSPVKTSACQILASAPSWFLEGDTPDELRDVFDKDRTDPDYANNKWED